MRPTYVDDEGEEGNGGNDESKDAGEKGKCGSHRYFAVSGVSFGSFNVLKWDTIVCTMS